MLVDLMLGAIDGFSFIRRVRPETDAPIIVVSARSGTDDIVSALEAGADDYVSKPYVVAEVEARLKALLRRPSIGLDESDDAASPVEHIELDTTNGPLRLFVEAGMVKRGEDSLHLTSTEFRLLAVLAERPGRVLSREVLLERVWDHGYFGDNRIVDVHMRRLRQKVERPQPSQDARDGARARISARSAMNRSRLGLRSTVIAVFAVGALMLSATLAAATYLTARHFLIDQREHTAVRQALTDAPLVSDSLSTSGSQVSDALGVVSFAPTTVAFVHRSGQWYSSSLDVSADVISPAMRQATLSGEASSTWTSATDPNAIVVGVPLPDVDAEYFEVTTAGELEGTLAALRTALIICAVLTTIAGGALGRFAAARLLSPLNQVTTAAARISAGDLNTRMAATRDPDLVALVGAFNSMVDALDERIRRDARFAADVSHELKTPLTTLTTSLTVLERAKDMPPRAQSAVGLMAGELERFRTCLEDLLSLGRLDAGVSTTQRSVLDLDEVVRQCLSTTGRPISLLLAPPAPAGRDLRVLIDKSQICRALSNILDNADLHAGGVCRLMVERHGDYGDVVIEDRGPGVDPEDRERIFQRFARAGSRGSQRGTGLGLSIVAETMHEHRGSVWCTAAHPQGARFVIRFPLVRSDYEAES